MNTMINFKRKDLDVAWGIKLDEDLSFEIVVPESNLFAIMYPVLLCVTFIVGVVAIPFIWYKQFVITEESV